MRELHTVVPFSPVPEPNIRPDIRETGLQLRRSLHPGAARAITISLSGIDLVDFAL